MTTGGSCPNCGRFDCSGALGSKCGRITELERERDTWKWAVEKKDAQILQLNDALARAEAEAAALRVEIGDARASLADALERIGLWSNPPHEWARDRVHNAYKTLGTCLSTTTAGAALLAKMERYREALAKIRDKWSRHGDEDWLIADAALGGQETIDEPQEEAAEDAAGD